MVDGCVTHLGIVCDIEAYVFAVTDITVFDVRLGSTPGHTHGGANCNQGEIINGRIKRP